ncbi:chloride channel protein [Rhizomicrobium palustre]
MLGAVVGVVIYLLREAVVNFHRLSFDLPAGALLSTGQHVSEFRLMLVPLLGGLALGFFRHAARRRSAEIIDPIEANALYGGRMSFRDSIRLALTTMLSNASGASLGMEAGYTQLGAGFYSMVGRKFRLRRADLRVFVTAGAGAAISAAFNAPLAGAFYGFELIQGGYTTRALAQVAVACICSVLVAQALSPEGVLFVVPQGAALTPLSYYLFAGMGFLAAGIAVLAMRSVTWTEKALRALPEWTRPAIGGFAVSLIALAYPQVLGSGHGAIQFHFDSTMPWLFLAALLFAKLFASAISVGSGFRGGLFSSSLFLGALFGALFVQIAGLIYAPLLAERSAFMLAGMGAVAAGIIGAPLTMVFLTLEATGDFALTAGVLLSVIISATIVRLSFGYSFSTWRFHQRGLAIRSAHDVGWISELSVGRLMRSDPKVVTADTSLRALRELFPPGSTKRLYVIDKAGHYAGRIDILEAHDPSIDDALPGLVAGDLAMDNKLYLLPGLNLRDALIRFEDSQSDSLPVLASETDLRPIGYLTEAYALKRYTQELERIRGEETGSDLYSLGQTSQG